MDATIITALLGLVGIGLTAWLSRRRDDAEVEKITASAHQLVYDGFRELLDEQRAAVVRTAEEAREIRHRAGIAERRAAEAEAAAEYAADQAREAVRLLAELRPLIAKYVPEAHAWLPRVDQVVAAAATG